MIQKARDQAVEKERKKGLQFLMMPKLLSWIVIGLNEGDNCLRVRKLLGQWKVDIDCFQETRLEAMSKTIILMDCP